MTLLELIANCINYTTQDDTELNPIQLENFRNSSNYSAFIKNALPEINRAVQEIVAWKKLPLEVMELTHLIVKDEEVKENENNTVANPFIELMHNKRERKLKFELTKQQKEKIYSIFKMEIEDINGNTYSPVEYRRRNNSIIVPYFEGSLLIKYYPRIRILKESDKGTIEFGNETTEITMAEFVELIKNKSLVLGNIYKITDLKENIYKIATSYNGYRDATSEDGHIEVDDSIDLEELGINELLCNMVIPLLVKANIWQEVEPEMAQLERNKALQNLSLLETVDDEPFQTSVATTNSYDWR